jgi:hypothetical protein
MPQKLLTALMLGRCSHEFSWPRRTADGSYYQVCMLCATQYKYDWKTMRRTERVDATAEEAPARRSHRTGKKPTWVPRARRVPLAVPLRYRAKNSSTWYAGKIENISQSGVLLHGEHPFPANTLVEMVFEMPEEISGQKDANVLCQGRVIRLPESKKTDKLTLAATILDYRFLHQRAAHV